MIKKSILAISIAALIGMTGCQITAPNNAPSEKASESYQVLPDREDIFKYQLENGMQVILQPRKSPGVEMRLLVHSGSLQEEDQQRGLAHFVEHMAFKGTTNFPDSESFKQLEAKGINLGSHINAVTSYNSTVYKLSLPNSSSKTTDLGLRILSDWASEIRFDEHAFDSEREVIVEEWRLRQGVGARINEQLEQLRYQGSRLAERNAIGTIDVIRNAPVEEAIAYYKKWYQPQRMTLVINGSFDNFAVRSQIDSLFGTKERGTTPEDPVEWQEFESKPELQLATVFDAENSRRFIQLLLQDPIDTPLNTTEGQWRDTLDAVWLSILNERLAILVANGQLKSATAAPQSHLLSKKQSQYLLIAHPKGNDYAETFTKLVTELQRLATQPANEQELARAKNKLLNKVEQQAKYSARYSNQYLADQLVQADSYQLPMIDKEQQLAMQSAFLKSLTADELQKRVDQIMTSITPKLALVGADNDAQGVDTTFFEKEWDKIRDTEPEPFNLTKPVIDLKVTPIAHGSVETKNAVMDFGDNPVYEYQLSNGMKVVVVSRPELRGETQINVRIPGGRSLESDNEKSIVDWAGKYAEQCGYGEYSQHQIALWSKQQKVRVSPYSELLYHGFSGVSDADHLNDALALLHLKLTKANRCEDKLDEMKTSMQLNLSKVPAERVFMDQIHLEAFSHGDRLTMELDGAWQQFTEQELTDWRKKLYGDPAQMVTTIVTNLDTQKVEPLLDQWLASLSGVSQEKLEFVDRGVKPKAVSQEYTYDIGSSNKAMVQMQYSAEHAWSYKQQVQLQLLEQITNNRLREAVRVKASGVYVIHMSQMLARDPSPYYLGRLNFTTAPSRARKLATLASSVIAEIQQNGVTAQELDQAKQAWDVNYQQQIEYSDYWISAFSQDSFTESPYQAIGETETLISNATLADINTLASELFNQSKKTFYLMPKNDAVATKS